MKKSLTPSHTIHAGIKNNHTSPVGLSDELLPVTIWEEDIDEEDADEEEDELEGDFDELDDFDNRELEGEDFFKKEPGEEDIYDEDFDDLDDDEDDDLIGEDIQQFAC